MSYWPLRQRSARDWHGVVLLLGPLPDLNGCSEARQLLDCYTAALTAFNKSQEVLLAGLLPDDPRYPEARRLKDRAFGILLRARKVYWDHVTEHKCRGPISPTEVAAKR